MRWPSKSPRGALGRLAIAGGVLLAIAPLAPSSARAEEDGKSLFGSFCASCHGADGRAKTSPGHYYRIPDWTTTDATKRLKDDQIRKQIRTGKLADGPSGMPAFRTLSDAQVDLLTAYVRKLSGGSGV
jgi:mono/diheme cytochrome c family protein